jgi:hypothetical protein
MIRILTTTTTTHYIAHGGHPSNILVIHSTTTLSTLRLCRVHRCRPPCMDRVLPRDYIVVVGIVAVVVGGVDAVVAVVGIVIVLGGGGGGGGAVAGEVPLHPSTRDPRQTPSQRKQVRQVPRTCVGAGTATWTAADRLHSRGSGRSSVTVTGALADVAHSHTRA